MYELREGEAYVLGLLPLNVYVAGLVVKRVVREVHPAAGRYDSDRKPLHPAIGEHCHSVGRVKQVRLVI